MLYLLKKYQMKIMTEHRMVWGLPSCSRKNAPLLKTMFQPYVWPSSVLTTCIHQDIVTMVDDLQRYTMCII